MNKKYITHSLLAVTCIVYMDTTLNAGSSKLVVPANAQVAPIPEVISPIPFYIGVGVIASFIHRDPCPCYPNGEDLDDLRYGWVARLGYDFNQYIGIEARALQTLGSDNFSDVKHYGLYLKPQYHITEQINIYTLLGYGRTTVDYTNGVISSQTKENGFSYGVGFEYDFAKDTPKSGTYDRVFDGQGNQESGWGLWVDFQHLLNNAGAAHTDSNLITAGITYDF